VFLSLSKLKPEMRPNDLRYPLRADFPFFFFTKVTRALVYLGIEPSHFQIKQVFIFLLGQAIGYSVEKILGNIETQVKTTLSPVIKEFKQACHKLTVSVRKKNVLSYYKKDYTTDIQKICPLSDLYSLEANTTY
jgi:hypothetical protein